MTFALDDYIEKYIRNAKYTTNKKIAQHLKEIIPQTTHLNRETFKEIIEELKKEMDNGINFKKAYLKILKKFILTGDIIKAQLPDILTRIILNVRRLLEYLSKKMGVDMTRLEKRITSDGIDRFIRSIDFLNLAPNSVVLSTFDEEHPDKDPFINSKVNDVINMLALDIDEFSEGEPLTALKVRYENIEKIEKRYPFFFDAGWYDKFYPPDKDDKYGRTRSLDSSLKNMPEIAHKNLKISDTAVDIQLLKG
jgi:hypothetical protein